MHLLFTDPSTSPRTELGRIIFGVLYASERRRLVRGAGSTGSADLLRQAAAGAVAQPVDSRRSTGPLDRICSKRFDPGALGRSLTPKRRNLAYMTLWVALFVTMQAQTGAEATLARADSLKDQGRMEEALTRYREFVQGNPDDFEGQRRLGGGAARGRPRRRRGALAAAAPSNCSRAAPPRTTALATACCSWVSSTRRRTISSRRSPSTPTTRRRSTALAWRCGPADSTTKRSARFATASAGGRRAPRRTTTSARCSSEAAISTPRSRRTHGPPTIDPSYADANFALGLIHAKRGEQAQAIERFGRVLRSKPDSTPARTQLAWLLATSPDATPEDHRTALALAEPLVGGASDPDAGALDVLAAALAANGQFDRAAATAERMLAALGRDGADPRTLAAARDRLALYRSGKAYVSAARP